MTPDLPDAPAPGDRTGAGRRAPHPFADEPLPELDFSVEGASVEPHAAVPTLRFDLRVDAGATSVRSLSLNTQVRIVATGRRYDAGEEARLFEVFGAPREWGRSLRSLLWAHTSSVVTAFEGSRVTDLRVPCSYDFDVAANKYLHALRRGDVPLEFLFSGSVFYEGPNGGLRTARLPWDRECRFDMPARMWHEMMERYFPNSAWLRVRRDVFDRLLAFRSGQGLPTWEATLEALLPDEAPPSEGEGS